MANVATNRDLVFDGTELQQNRMLLEKRKMMGRFPGFAFYGTAGTVTATRGTLRTNFGNHYGIRIAVPDGYPYSIPSITVEPAPDSDCRHVYRDGSICVMKPEQWSKTYSLALLVAKTALWLNKYDLWKSMGKGRWPGKEQRHGLW